MDNIVSAEKCCTAREKTIYEELNEVNGKVSEELMKRIYGIIDGLEERVRELKSELVSCREEITSLERANVCLSKMVGEASSRFDFKAYDKLSF